MSEEIKAKVSEVVDQFLKEYFAEPTEQDKVIIATAMMVGANLIQRVGGDVVELDINETTRAFMRENYKFFTSNELLLIKAAITKGATTCFEIIGK